MPNVSSAKSPMLRTPEAAAYCGSSASTFEKLRLSGFGPRYVKIGRRVVYDLADLDAWLGAIAVARPLTGVGRREQPKADEAPGE